MTIHYQGHGVTLHHGDCLDVLRSLPDCSVDSVVTDPPYGLEFMGKDWDAPWKAEGAHWREASRLPGSHSTNPTPRPQNFGTAGKPFQDWCEQWARECLRVLKPGGHLLAFGGTRTWHRLACAVEDAGFEVRDSIARFHSIDMNNAAQLMKVWQEWTERVPSAGLRFRELGGSSAGDRVLLEPSHDESPARALIADLCSSGHPPTPAETWPSVASNVGAGSTASSALVTIAGASPESRGQQPGTTGSSAPSDAPEWLAASREATTRAAEALRIWLGAKPSSRPGATDALCAALSNALKHITCAHSETFRSYDTTWQTVCVSATTATTTASTAASLLAFTADTLAGLDPEEVMPLEADSGPLAWVYGSGFPRLKSLDVSKAIDKAAGATREKTGSIVTCDLARYGEIKGDMLVGVSRGSAQIDRHDEPATDAAREWEGWGTALKPAFEPVVVARKPLIGTVAATVLAHGTGALNIAACRIEGEADLVRPAITRTDNDVLGKGLGAGVQVNPSGRWPANVVLDPECATLLDEQSGDTTRYFQAPRQGDGKSIDGSVFGQHAGDGIGYNDTGGASRYFYVAKADASERPRVNGTAHPTVKPLALMRWLVRLVTPPGGTVLEPFAGSGTTVEACIIEGFDCIAIEKGDEYLPLIMQRIHRRRDPVAAIRQTGDELGLFELDGEGA